MPDTPYDPLTASFLAAQSIAESVKPPDTDGSVEGILDIDAAYSTPGVTIGFKEGVPDPDAYNLNRRPTRRFDGSRVPQSKQWEPGDDA